MAGSREEYKLSHIMISLGIVLYKEVLSVIRLWYVCDNTNGRGDKMDKPSGFYTLKGYQLNTQIELTTAMEDYLEMIYRITLANNRIKVSDLSKRLHVKPSSVTKMLQQLNHAEYIKTEKYGDITITEKGRRMGEYLLYRHDVIHRFLCVLNHSENELEQVEKIEHFLDEKTVKNIDSLIEKLKKENPISEPK